MDCCLSIVCAGEKSLGLKLVNKGYDLWMANSRGNRYSRDHVKADDELFTQHPKENDEYWKFSFSEMAKYDQPALWRYIEGVTG
jgi:lysosomal acid lipase/cholesteryl ester hydrolase